MGGNGDACVLLCVTMVGHSGALASHTGLSLVLQMWPWAQACTLAIHKKKGMGNRVPDSGGVPAWETKHNTGIILKTNLITALTTRPLGEAFHFFLARSPTKTESSMDLPHWDVTPMSRHTLALGTVSAVPALLLVPLPN